VALTQNRVDRERSLMTLERGTHNTIYDKDLILIITIVDNLEHLTK